MDFVFVYLPLQLLDLIVLLAQAAISLTLVLENHILGFALKVIIPAFHMLTQVLDFTDTFVILLHLSSHRLNQISEFSVHKFLLGQVTRPVLRKYIKITFQRLDPLMMVFRLRY